MEPNGVPARDERPARPWLPGRRAERDPAPATCPDESCTAGPADATAEVLDLCTAAERAVLGGDPSLAPDLLLAAALRGWRARTGAAARERIAALAASPAGQEPGIRRIATLALAQPVRQAAWVMGELGRFRAEQMSDAEDLHLLGTAAHAVGEPVLAADFLDRAESLLRAQDRLGPLPCVLATQARALLDLGDRHRAARAAEEIRRLTSAPGHEACTVEAVTTGAQAAALRGDTEAALLLVDRAAGHSAEAGARVRLVRGIAACADGRYEAAYDLLRGLFPEEDGPDPGAPGPYGVGLDPPEGDGQGSDSPAPDGGSPCRDSFGAIGFLAEAALHLRRRGDAAAVAGSLARRTAGSPASLLRVQLRYAAAVLADDVEAETLFRRALADNLARWPWPRARAECAYGRWLRLQRRTAEARPLLRSARLAFERIGARPWAERAADELRAAGEPPRPSG
ncbi:hypothetical protein [Streptomyces sp. MBT27]|uniref:hypothetical protein n=1 Tax=Streptomyces sp. MBT27 TaxID=1488356 RepID=UPI0014204B0D|nr:hypothetical protein [Streptomyces sp. MBT27]